MTVKAEKGTSQEFDPTVGYRHIRGFNYQPSYEATGYAIWRYFKPDVIERELGRGKECFPGMNTIRIWLSFDAFVMDPDRFMSSFSRFIDIAARHDIKIMPVLFCNWHSLPNFGGVSGEHISCWFDRFSDKGKYDNYFAYYVRTLVEHHKNDSRVLMWDLCNEPFNNDDPDRIEEWLCYLYRVCKEAGAGQPVCVGGNVAQPERMDSSSDVLTIHPYGDTGYIKQMLALGRREHKPVLVTECAKAPNLLGREAKVPQPSRLPEGYDEQRAEILVRELTELKKFGLGFLCHLLYETLVADGHRPDLGPCAGYMAFIERDGKIRKGHEVFNDF